MRRFVLLFVLAIVSLGAQAATYQYTGTVYVGVTDFTPPCDPGATCQNYPPAGRVTGQFTTAAPLGTLSDTSIVALVTSYSFSDGVHTFSSSDNHSRVLLFRVTTNLSGQITAAHISLQQWATASQPHVTNDWFGNLFINSTNGALLVRHNTRCDVVDAFDDTCGVTTSDTTSQSGASALAGTWTTVATSGPTSVPTLSEWALLLLAALMATGTAWRTHRPKRATR